MPEKPDPETKPEDGKQKKLSFMGKLKLVFNGVSRKELKHVFADTLKDLRKPKEIGIFAVSCIVPGGWVGYAAYRIARYKFKHKPANDNAAEKTANPAPAEKAKKRPKAPKP